jgi:hypothetical protein
MGDSVPSDDTARHNWSSLSVPMREAPEREDEALGVLWRVKPTTAHQRKLTAARDAADVIRYRRATGNHDGAARYSAPLEEVMAALPCPEPEKREEIADGAEDVRQGEWRANPSEQTLRALLRARASERQASLDLDRALVAKAPAEWGVTL